MYLEYKELQSLSFLHILIPNEYQHAEIVVIQ